jgi:hypothetical protein
VETVLARRHLGQRAFGSVVQDAALREEGSMWHRPATENARICGVWSGSPSNTAQRVKQQERCSTLRQAYEKEALAAKNRAIHAEAGAARTARLKREADGGRGGMTRVQPCRGGAHQLK